MWSLLLGIIGMLLALGGLNVLCKGGGSDKPIGLGIVGLGFLILPGSIISKMIGGFIILVAIIWGIVYSQNEKDGTNAKKRAEEQRQIQREYEQAVASQEPGEPWKIRYATDPCPHCGHYKVRYAKWEDKRMSVAFWGAASDKIGKLYKCEHCGEMW